MEVDGVEHEVEMFCSSLSILLRSSCRRWLSFSVVGGVFFSLSSGALLVLLSLAGPLPLSVLHVLFLLFFRGPLGFFPLLALDDGEGDGDGDGFGCLSCLFVRFGVLSILLRSSCRLMGLNMGDY